MSDNNVTTALLGIGLLLAVLGQFLPSGEGEATSGGFGFQASTAIDAYPWGVHLESQSNFASSSDNQDWFEYYEDSSGEDGETLLKTQMVLHYFGIALAFIALVVGATGSVRSAGVLATVGGAAYGLALLLFARGVNAAFDGFVDLGFGFILGIIATLGILAGGVMQLSGDA